MKAKTTLRISMKSPDDPRVELSFDGLPNRKRSLRADKLGRKGHP